MYGCACTCAYSGSWECSLAVFILRLAASLVWSAITVLEVVFQSALLQSVLDWLFKQQSESRKHGLYISSCSFCTWTELWSAAGSQTCQSSPFCLEGEMCRTAGSRDMGKSFQEAGHLAGAHSSWSSEASPAGQNHIDIDDTKAVVGLLRSKGRGGSERVLLR